MWLDDYIGLPWKSGGQGPRSFDCWGFVRFINDRHFRRQLPPMAIDADNLGDCLRAFRDNVGSGQWGETKKPSDGDVCLLGNGKYGEHCGVVVGNVVAHCERGCGVVAAPAARLPWRWHHFYRWVG